MDYYVDRYMANSGQPRPVETENNTCMIAPSKLRVEASSICQLKCPSCPRTTDSFRSVVGNGFLKFSDFKRLIDENSWVREIELSNYGEIFLNPELLRMMEYAHRHGVTLKADTGVNLNNVTDEVLEGLVKYEFRNMAVSLDGASSETYSIYRVKGNFDTVIQNIKKVNLFKQQYLSQYPHLIWQFIVFGHNEHEIELAQKMADELGMDFSMKLTWDALFSPVRDTERVRKLVGAVSREEFKQEHGVDYQQTICYQLWDRPQINWDGKLLGCCRNFWGDFGAGAFENDLLNSINSEKLNYARDMLLGEKPAREDIPCSTCSIYQQMQEEGNYLKQTKPDAGESDSDSGMEKLQVITPVKRDFEMLVTPGFYADRYGGNLFEDFTSDLLLNFARDNMLFVDIGAHYGYYTLLVGTKYPNCKIMAFEPVPENFEILRQNVALHKLHNVELHNVAVSNNEERRKLWVTEFSSRSSLYRQPWKNPQKEIDIQTVCLDNLIKATPDVPIIIKIDAEGHEPYVLQGMQKLLTCADDIRLIIEFYPRCLKSAGYEPGDLLEDIFRLGFDIYAIDDSTRIACKLSQDSVDNWRDSISDRNEDKVTNLICIKKQQSISVCFFSHSSGIKGAGRSLLELVTELVKDHRVVCSVLMPDDGPLKQRLEEIGASTLIENYDWWCDITAPSPADMTRRLVDSFRNVSSAVIPVLNRLNPDIIYTNTILFPWGAVAAYLMNKPHVWHVREFGVIDAGNTFFKPFDSCLDFIVRSSNLVLTNSEAVRNTLFSNISIKDAETVYNYVNIPVDAVLHGSNDCFLRPESTKLIISGVVYKSKGQMDAVLAVRELIKRKRDVELKIMGHTVSDYIERLQEIVKEYNLQSHVTFLDFQVNPYPIVAQADIVLVCSRNEAFGRVTVEGMLLKKPVIGTNTGGTPELIKDGFNGLLYQPGDYLQLADKIEYLIENRDKIAELGENGYQFAKTKFTESAYGGRIYQLLAGIKEQPNPLASSNPDFVTSLVVDVLTQIEEKDAGLEVKDTQLGEKDARLVEKNTQLEQKNAQLGEMRNTVQVSDSQLKLIQQSISVQLANRYQKVADKLFRPGTRIGYYYGLGLTAIRIILNYGWSSFWHEFRQWYAKLNSHEDDN